MTDEIRNKIDKNILPYLDEIAERLWSGHASLMVGAGFSKNANADFPDWTELGDLFYEKIHRRKPSNNEARYLNVLKLADEVRAAFGRPALDQLIRTNIPENSSPSKLHIQALNLPWVDVFTTNYDTLLEKARDSVFSKRFDVVVNKEDLVYSRRPRIVKLHGSFPSQRPFIITEEDYRQYPTHFAPFINTIQQTLLENALCLIGFSGDDPNFLRWIGWIRDNLGRDNSPKIFFVGIVELSEAKKKLLEQQNIVVVDLSNCLKVNGDHKKALDLFFDYLSKCKDVYSRMSWPKEKKLNRSREELDKVNTVMEVVQVWKESRHSYPGWVVLPQDKRNRLWESTRSWLGFISAKDKLPDFLDLEFAFELNWRLERSLCPIVNNLPSFFEAVINKYWHYLESNHDETPVAIDRKNTSELEFSVIKEMCVDISIAMLRFYREEGLLKKWKEANKKIDPLLESLSSEKRALVHYERVLYSLFSLNFPKVKQELADWPTDSSLPFWESKRAGIFAEIGETKTAISILEESLKEIRSKQNLTPIKTDYSLVSQESVVLFLVWQTKKAVSFNDTNSNVEEVWKEAKDSFTACENKLKKYGCDTWDDLEVFNAQLNHSSATKAPVSEKHGFDIGQITRSSHFKVQDDELLNAFAFLRYFEECGFPFRVLNSDLAKKNAKGAASRLSDSSPYWAAATIIRTGDDESVDLLFNRKSVALYSTDTADDLIDKYLDTLDTAKPDISCENGRQIDNFGVLLAHVIPEVLSRLCCKCSYEKKVQLLDFLCYLYGSENKNNYCNIKNLLKRLLKSFSKSEQYKLIPKLLEFPVPEGLNNITESDFPNPFSFIYIDKLNNKAAMPLSEEVIKKLLSLAGSNDPTHRRWGITTLFKLNESSLLSEQQVKAFGEVLWAQTDDSGFPKHTGYYRFVFLKKPYSPKIDPSDLMREYIKTLSFPIQAHKENPNSFALTNEPIDICNQIIGTKESIDWTEEEIDSIFQKLVEWWDADKQYLVREKGPSFFIDIPKKFESRFLKLREVLTKVIFPNLNQDTKIDLSDVQRIINEYEEYSLPNLWLIASSLHLSPEMKDDFLRRIEDGLTCNEHTTVIDSLDALVSLIECQSTHAEKKGSFLGKEEVERILLVAGQMIRWRHQTGLTNTLRIACFIIHKYPSFLNGEFESLCLKGLHSLIEDTDVKKDLEISDFSEKLSVRKEAAKLAFIMSKYYKDQGKSIPDEIQSWKNICSSKDEFAEIRVQWDEPCE
jgi:SIR2-like protein